MQISSSYGRRPGLAVCVLPVSWAGFRARVQLNNRRMNHVQAICGSKDPEAVRFLNSVLSQHAQPPAHKQKASKPKAKKKRARLPQKQPAAPRQPSVAQLRKAGTLFSVHLILSHYTKPWHGIHPAYSNHLI